MNRRNSSVLVLSLLIAGSTWSQPGPGRPAEGMPQATLTGQVADADLGTPIEYVNVVLFSRRDSQQVTGTITDRNGRFELGGLRPGRFYLELSFIGYRTRTVSDIQLAPGERRDLGRLTLRQTALAMPGVEATAERPALTFKIDKKVIEVAGRPQAAAGTAVDVLENVPSVKVDIEGNVTLRGSSNFKVLIDGRPSPLEPSEALQQIPSSTIENIEIITNPSAQYDPEGISGIINVILKKQRVRGSSSIANLRGSLDGSYGGDFLWSYRPGSVNLFLGADYNRHRFPGTRIAESWTRKHDTTTYVRSSGTSTRQGQPYGLRAGADCQLGPADKLSLDGRLGWRGFNSTSQTVYGESIWPGNRVSNYQSADSASRSGEFYSLNLGHGHNFRGEGHELSGQVNFIGRNGNEAVRNGRSDSIGNVISGQRTAETGPWNMLRIKLDYTRPLRTTDRFGVGYQSQFSRAQGALTTW